MKQHKTVALEEIEFPTTEATRRGKIKMDRY